MKIYRCLICGDTYIGSSKPSQCPFCGSHSPLIVLSVEYPPNINEVKLTKTEKADLLHSVELELYNTRFYVAMGKQDHDSMLASAYRALAKVEREHLIVFSKLLKQPVPAELSDPLDIPEDWCANIEASSAQEIEARDFYREAAGRAVDPRVRQVFFAIADVEADHISVDRITHAYVGCKD